MKSFESSCHCYSLPQKSTLASSKTGISLLKLVSQQMKSLRPPWWNACISPFSSYLLFMSKTTFLSFFSCSNLLELKLRGTALNIKKKLLIPSVIMQMYGNSWNKQQNKQTHKTNECVTLNIILCYACLIRIDLSGKAKWVVVTPYERTSR